ncbi:MAG: alpha/beta hydrolase [Chloroflexi bacterium]|nr:alpha/beta hydrolase [Chloroflexota bacterium]
MTTQVAERIEGVESHWTRVSGWDLHARVSVDPVPPGRLPVVLLHGLVVSSRYMVPTAERLAAYHSTYALDLPGFGRSAKPRHVLTIAELADTVAAWMASSGLERAALVGDSFGCQVAVEVALRHTRLADRLVLIGPTADPGARSALRQAARWLLNATREPLALGPILVRDYLDAGFDRFYHTLRYLLQDRIEDKLPHVQAPTLIVRGARDPIVPQSWAEQAARLLPRGRLIVVPEAAHTVNFNAAEELVRLMRPFLDD